jgi:hypothetical protein
VRCSLLCAIEWFQVSGRLHGALWSVQLNGIVWFLQRTVQWRSRNDAQRNLVAEPHLLQSHAYIEVACCYLGRLPFCSKL